MSNYYVENLEWGTERERSEKEKGWHRSRSAHPSSFCGAVRVMNFLGSIPLLACFSVF